MSPTHRRTPKRSPGVALLVLLLMSLSACATSPQVARAGAPGWVNPCVRNSNTGFWTCVHTKRVAWFEGKRARTKAWLGPRARR